MPRSSLTGSHVMVYFSCLLVLACLAHVTSTSTSTTSYTAPQPEPSFVSIASHDSTNIHLQVNVTYITDQLYTYVFSFHPWSDSSSIFLPNNCSNRLASEFNINNPVLWTSLWSRLDLLNETAISGTYLAWPTPSLPWTLRIPLPGSHTVVYEGEFDLSVLVECAGTGLRVSANPTEFTYSGTFYVTWVQPVTAYLPGLPLTAEYSTRSYSFPFQFGISRLVDTTDVSAPYPSRMFSFLSRMGWIPSSDTLYNYEMVLHVRVPASRLASTGALLHYNRVWPLVTSVTGASYGLVLEWDTEASAPECALSSTTGECSQTLVFRSSVAADASTMAETIGYNDTFLLFLVLQSCSSIDVNVCQSYEPEVAATIPLSLDVYLEKKQVTHTLAPFESNLTFWTDTNFTTIRSNDIDYDRDDFLVLTHELTTSHTGYELWIQNVYACAPVSGERENAPEIGFSEEWGIWRKGCSEPEYLGGILNIPSSHIWTLATNTTAVAEEASLWTVYRFGQLQKAGASFSLLSIPDALVGVPFYLHVESALFLPGSTTNGHLYVRSFVTMVESESETRLTGSQRPRTATLTEKPIRLFDAVSEESIYESSADSDATSKLAWIIGLSVGGGLLLVSLVVGGVAVYKGWISCATLTSACARWSVSMYRAVPVAPTFSSSPSSPFSSSHTLGVPSAASQMVV